MLIVLSDGIIQSGYLSIEVNTENHTQFEDQSVSMYVRICPLKPANQLVDVVISFCCKWFQLHFGLPQLVFQLPTPFKLYSSSISTQEQFLWSVPLIFWTSWSEYWKKESQLMLANLIILFQLHKRVHHLGFFSVIPSLSPQSKRSVQSCKQWKGHREREREAHIWEKTCFIVYITSLHMLYTLYMDMTSNCLEHTRATSNLAQFHIMELGLHSLLTTWGPQCQTINKQTPLPVGAISLSNRICNTDLLCCGGCGHPRMDNDVSNCKLEPFLKSTTWNLWQA